MRKFGPARREASAANATAARLVLLLGFPILDFLFFGAIDRQGCAFERVMQRLPARQSAIPL